MGSVTMSTSTMEETATPAKSVNGSGHRPPLSTILPPMILGSATFNSQYVRDPSAMPARPIVSRAFDLGIRAFDTSPYYGPAELLLGDALAAAARPRDSYLLISKAGRVGPTTFDYSPAAVTASIHRSLERLRTPYLDLAYLHDVEFVTTADVLAGLGALRALQSQGLIRYVGISGYPVARLLELAEAITATTGSPVDAILSYAHFSVQNTILAAPETLARFRRAGVDVVLNASILAMGLLTPGISAGPQESWHPAPEGLRAACVALRKECAARGGKRLEEIAIEYALREWGRLAIDAGVAVGRGVGQQTVGGTVIGVTSVRELEETMAAWASACRDLGLVEDGHKAGVTNGNGHVDAVGGAKGGPEDVVAFVRDVMWPILGEWKDFSWDSPHKGWFDEHGNVVGSKDPMSNGH